MFMNGGQVRARRGNWRTTARHRTFTSCALRNAHWCRRCRLCRRRCRSAHTIFQDARRCLRLRLTAQFRQSVASEGVMAIMLKIDALSAVVTEEHSGPLRIGWATLNKAVEFLDRRSAIARLRWAFNLIAAAESVAGALGWGAIEVDDELAEVAASPASTFSISSVGSIGGLSGGITVLIKCKLAPKSNQQETSLCF